MTHGKNKKFNTKRKVKKLKKKGRKEERRGRKRERKVGVGRLGIGSKIRKLGNFKDKIKINYPNPNPPDFYRIQIELYF